MPLADIGWDNPDATDGSGKLDGAARAEGAADHADFGGAGIVRAVDADEIVRIAPQFLAGGRVVAVDPTVIDAVFAPLQHGGAVGRAPPGDGQFYAGRQVVFRRAAGGKAAHL